MTASIARLPIDASLPELVDGLRRCAAAVVTASPGAGKTTRVPPALLASGIAGEGRIVMLQPRRIAARAAARRIAFENGWQVGGEVGWQVRFDRQFTERSRIVVLTEGLLVQWLQRDPFLEGTSIVVFDEFHERNLQADLALAMTCRLKREARPDLRLVVMSATLDTEPLLRYLGSPADRCQVNVVGRNHPVAVRHLVRPELASLDVAMAKAVRQALAETSGSVLAFLPGRREIAQVARRLAALAATGVEVLPLHGGLAAEEQDRALQETSSRRVILATNVAETSVTVCGVTAVVDSGLMRAPRFDARTGLDRLELMRISRASAEQRAGRAGREQPGLALRLWSEMDHWALPAQDAPEVARLDVAGAVLQLLAWGERDPRVFPWFEAPAAGALDAAVAQLSDLGAVDERGLTALGRRLANVPLAPRLGRLLLAGADAGHPDAAAAAVAALSAPTRQRRGASGSGLQMDGRATRSGRSDVLDRADAIVPRTGAHRSESSEARELRLIAGQLRRSARSSGSGRASVVAGGTSEGIAEGMAEELALLRAVFLAFPDRVARRRGDRSDRAVLVGGRGVRLASESVVLEDEFFVAVDVDDGVSGAEGLVRVASAVEREWLDESARWRDELRFDEAREAVVGRRVATYRDLVIEEHDAARASLDAPAVEAMLARAAEARMEHALGLDRPAIAQWRARVRWLGSAMPELELPAPDDEALRELLPVLVAGRRSFRELRDAPVRDVLAGMLSARQLATLEREAPARLTVPSGKSIALHYGEPGSPPVLAVRIQEIFGWSETPRLAAGRVPVLLHLLAPNGRPQQVTQDLASFWATTYREVRRELAGRYPKHAWPEDPVRAQAQRRSAARSPGRRPG